jgi:hypothetical protein
MKTLKLIFQSLLNNAAVMEARKEPWYVAIIIFLLSVVFATYPTFSQINARAGSDFLTRETYSMDQGLVDFSETLYNQDIQLVVRTTTLADQTTTYLANEDVLWRNVFTQTLTETNFPYYEYRGSTGQVRLRVFYQADQSDESAVALINRLLNLETGHADIATFLMLGRTAVYFYVYNPGAIAANTASGSGYIYSFNGTYTSVPLNTNLGNFIALDSSGFLIDPVADFQANASAYETRIFTHWKQFFDQSFLEAKSVLLIAQSGLTLVVNTIMALMMSLVIFLMTRGKNNPNRTLKFAETMKIGSWSLLSPALLTIVAGSFFPEFAGTAFVLFVGLRLMWLSSRYLRPMDMPTSTTVVKK